MLTYTLYKESRNFQSDEYVSVKWTERPCFMQCLECITKLIKALPHLISHFKTTMTPTPPSTNFHCVSFFHSTDPSNYKHNEDTLGITISFDVEHPEEPSICLRDLFQDNTLHPILPAFSLPLHQRLSEISRLFHSISTPPGLSTLLLLHSWFIMHLGSIWIITITGSVQRPLVQGDKALQETQNSHFLHLKA